ncbi:MAG: MBL fold metallo-hydrolase [Oscillospiraceae bacterium]|nr:MBL fold metallo-hydrolase [Oscillospiraceae bacterium]
MKLMFLGAAHEVTGSCSLLQVNGRSILIDCGMEQGADMYENCQLPVAANEIDAVCLTHAHIDHSGMLPALVNQGFTGPIYTTEATGRLCRIMLRDSAHIQEAEALWRNRKAERSGGSKYTPLYTMADAEQTLQQLQLLPYERKQEIFSGISVLFRDAGHLLGSASIYFELSEGEQTRSIVFSGDLGNRERPLINDPQPAAACDFAVIESTYGTRLHGARPDYVRQLTDVLQRTFDRGGNVVIPSFAVGRTQELLYLLRTIKEQGLIHGHDGFPVYVDSPMAVEATKIYAAGLTDYYDKETLELLSQGIDPICFDGLRLSVTADESKMINTNTEPKVILSASGMCEAGRIRHHLKYNLWREDSTVLFVGYQTQGTIGRKLQDGAAYVQLFGERIAVKASIETMEGISGHADQAILLDWLGSMGTAPKQVFVNHGDDEGCEGLARKIEFTLGYPAFAPYSGDTYDLLTQEWIAKGKIVKLKARSARADDLYDRLLAAGRRLNTVIRESKGLSNKLLSQFIDQIHQLCDKFEHK